MEEADSTDIMGDVRRSVDGNKHSYMMNADYALLKAQTREVEYHTQIKRKLLRKWVGDRSK